MWPPLTGAAFPETRRSDPDAVPEHFLSRLVDRLPRVTEPPQADTYLALLDRALIDRRISATESDALVASATALDLGSADVIDLHRGYLTDLAHAATAEHAGGTPPGGRTTPRPSRPRNRSISPRSRPCSAFRPAPSMTRSLGPPTTPTFPGNGYGAPRWTLSAGDIVVFTGETAEPRDVWVGRARSAGLRVEDVVTTDTHVVVAADVDTMSVKARKAHAVGVPVIDPATFLQMVRAASGVAPEPSGGTITT